MKLKISSDKFKKLSGSSLLEIIVVLAIVSVAVVASASLVARTNVVIKSNELQDQGNALMLKALEVFKSSDKVKVSNDVLTNASSGTYYFALNEDTSGATLKYDASGSPSSLDNCSSSSIYYVANLNLNLCLQIQVTPVVPVTGSKYYDVNIVVTYPVAQKQITDNLRTYRYYGFTDGTVAIPNPNPGPTPPPPPSAPQSPLPGWIYRQAIAITNSSGSGQSNFQVVLNLDTATLISTGKMKSTCDDLRITASDGTTLLPFWIEPNTCNTSTTKVWIKATTISVTSDTMYAYYGNSSALAAGYTTASVFIREISNVAAAYSLDETQEVSPSTIKLVSTNVAAANAYTYVKAFSNATIVATGDTFEYDVFLETNTTQSGGLDIKFTDGSYARTVTWTDQNGVVCHPNGSINTYAYGKWFHRICTIPSTLNGKTVSYIDLVNENDTATQVVSYYDNLVIKSNTGTLKSSIYTSGAPAFNAVDITSNASNTGTVSNVAMPSTTTYADSSGNNNQLANVGAVNVTGKFGNAASFDGVTDYLNAVYSSSLNMATLDLTLSAWVYPTQTSANDVYIIDRGARNGGVKDYALYFAAGTTKLTGNIFDSGGTAQAICSSSTSLPLNTWSYVAYTYTGGFGNCYLNGSLLSTSAKFTGTRSSDTSSPLQIGARILYAATTYFPGNIDEPRVYSQALSLAEITDVYGSGGNNLGYFTSNYPGKELIRKYNTSISSNMSGTEEVFTP